MQLSFWREPQRSENDRLLPGDGAIPLSEIVTTLERSNYRGMYEIEVWSRDLWKLEHHALVRACLMRSGTLLDQCLRAAAVARTDSDHP